MDNIVSVKLDSRYASTLGVWQYDYGQVLRITGPELPPAVEVQFSLDEKSGETLSRVGTTVDGVTEVKIPDELLAHSVTSNYRIYAYIYLTDEISGNTKYEITIPVRARSKPTSPTEDPETDPDLFRETVAAVNASAERAENAASSATESAASAEETLIEIKRVADGISEDIENANTAKSELSDTINSAGIEKKELELSIGKAGEAKMELDSSISSAGEQKLALDATVAQANTVDTSLKEQIGSAEQIQENVEQIAKNKADISSLNEDIVDLSDKKITKFYASNQGETHLADSDKGLVQDIKIYGQSEQSSTTGAQLFNENIEIKNRGVTIKINGSTATFKGTVSDEANARVNYQKNIKLKPGKYTASSSNEKIKADFSVEKANNEMIYNEHIEIDGTEKEVKIRVLFGLKPSAKGDVINETTNIMLNDGDIALPYEPYTGGQPSPSPDYPQEIKSVVNPVVKVCGKNLWDNFKTLSLGNVEQKNGTYIATADTIQVDITNDSIGARPLLLKANNAYTFSLKTTVSVSSPKFVCLRYTNGENNNIIFTNKNFVNFVPERDVEKIGFILYESVAGDKAYDVQLEMGSEVTSYEPYHEQSVQLPYTLNAIPVDSGGNITIDGQQYIADRVVEKDGVFGIERNTATDVPVLTKKLRETTDMKGRFIQDYAFKKTFTPLYTPLVNIGYSKVWGVAGNVIDKWIFGVNKANLYISPPKDLNYTSEDAFNALKDLNIKVYGALSVSIFEPLPEDIQSKLRTLVTNYPVTNVSITSDQLDGYTVFNYPISLANGWNYVKQQLGDTRDYIYDMDTKTQDIDLQSAEAYVNSEYAVALTELEA